MNTTGIIPQVNTYINKPGDFSLKERFCFRADTNAARQKSLLEGYLKEYGFQDFQMGETQQPERQIILRVEEDSHYDEAGFCDESYQIYISPVQIELSGKTSEGLARAVQTFRQQILTCPEGRLPCCIIKDSPRFRWRGMHLDVSRHFFPVEDVKAFIDQLALYRFNRLHLHLTDDQGWRIEIKKYPLLSEIGSVRQDTLIGHYNDTPRRYEHREYSGFFTQDEIREIVTFASRRKIVIIPEIDMPGHMQAAITAYPELGCGYHTQAVRPLWGISQDILNPHDTTISFMKNVLDEIMQLFPGKFIHIGGDEVPKYQWENSISIQKKMAEVGACDEAELQSWFIHQMDDFISLKGRRTIGWDEILEGGLADNAAVMSWRGEEGGIKSAGMDHDVVMTPQSHTYFDHYQSKPEKDEPLAIGGYSPLSKVYGYEPIPRELDKSAAHHVLGSQGQLWSEYIPDRSLLEYKAFPRACALAEVLWTAEEDKDYQDFLERLKKHNRIFKRLGLNAHPHPE